MPLSESLVLAWGIKMAVLIPIERDGTFLDAHVATTDGRRWDDYPNYENDILDLINHRSI